MKRFVHATLEAVKDAKADPDSAIAAIINWNASMEEDKVKVQARKVLDVTLSILISPNNKEKRLGLNVAEDWDSALALLEKYNDLKTDMTGAPWAASFIMVTAEQ